jgi:hypothetical protein
LLIVIGYCTSMYGAQLPRWARISNLARTPEYSQINVDVPAAPATRCCPTSAAREVNAALAATANKTPAHIANLLIAHLHLFGLDVILRGRQEEHRNGRLMPRGMEERCVTVFAR